MAHFAKVNNGVVVNVIVAEPEFFDTFVDTSPGEWIKTSYNTHGGIYYIPNTNTPDPDQSKSLRKNYAGIGYTYDHTIDAFIPPKPYPSWHLNNQTCLWEAPIPMPDDGDFYMWDEQDQLWIKVEQ
jgi:hypothetical protein